MAEKKTIAVVGATGAQGGGLVRAILEDGDGGFAVRAITRDAKSELFLLAVTNMVGEDTFYEASRDRDRRFVRLIRHVTAEDPAWVARFVPCSPQ